MWFVPCDWDNIAGLRHAGTKEEEKLADDRLLVFWFKCNPESEHEYKHHLSLYLGTIRGARADDVRSLIGAITKEASPSSQGLDVDGKPRDNAWTTIWARTLLTKMQLNQQDRDAVLRPIDDGWQRFLDSDLPKLKSAVAGLFEQKASR